MIIYMDDCFEDLIEALSWREMFKFDLSRLINRIPHFIICQNQFSFVQRVYSV